MARGKIKINGQAQQSWTHAYGTPFTPVQTGQNTRYIATSGSWERRSGETVMQHYKRLAKQADQRLVRIEKLSQQPGFEAVEQFAYKRAQMDIQRYTPGATRFNAGAPSILSKKRPTDPNEAKTYDAEVKKAEAQVDKKIRDIQTFLKSPTSTKTGIVQVYQKRADTINTKYGTDFTWQELAVYWESGIAEKRDRWLGGSGTRLQAFYSTIRDTNPEDIRKAAANHEVTSTPIESVKKHMMKYGYDYNKVIGG